MSENLKHQLIYGGLILAVAFAVVFALKKTPRVIAPTNTDESTQGDPAAQGFSIGAESPVVDSTPVQMSYNYPTRGNGTQPDPTADYITAAQLVATVAGDTSAELANLASVGLIM